MNLEFKLDEMVRICFPNSKTLHGQMGFITGVATVNEEGVIYIITLGQPVTATDPNIRGAFRCRSITIPEQCLERVPEVETN